MAKNTIIIHSGEQFQNGFIRMYTPAYVSKTQYLHSGMYIEEHAHPVQDANLMKDVQSVVIQKPCLESSVNLVAFYSHYRETYKFNIVLEFDDVLWEINDEWKKNVLKIANIPNFVVCSTRTLANEWKKISNRPAIVVPNSVSGFCVGRLHPEIQERLEKPVVLYGGSKGHENDFGENWIEFLKKYVAEDKIELHTFVDIEGIDNSKVIKHGFTTPVEWMATLSRISPDIYIAPLENCKLNKCKSDLKVKEAGALGCVFLGTDFASSPYGYIPKDMLVGVDGNVADKFDKLCEPAVYNKNRQWLRDSYERKGWDVMSQTFIKKWNEGYSNGREV